MWRLSIVVAAVVLFGGRLALSSRSTNSYLDFPRGRLLQQTGRCPKGVCDSWKSPSEWQFPFLASVKDESGRRVCTGSLIHKNVVLTAAHCVDILENPNVELGIFGGPGNGYESFKTTAKIVHPKFDQETKNVMHDYDVALLILDKHSKTEPVRLTNFAHPGCFKKERCMQVNLPTFWETYNGSGRYNIKNQRVLTHAWDQCWWLLSSSQKEKDSTICMSGVKENAVSCTGDGGPMLSADWHQTGIMNFVEGCTDVNKKTVHTLITPEIRIWIEEQIKDIKHGRTFGRTDDAIIAPPYCIFRNGFWFGGDDCKRLPKPKEDKGCYFFHGMWFGSKCPQRQKAKSRDGDGCAFLYGRWVGQNCKSLSRLPERKAGCIYQFGRWVGAGC